MTINQILDEQMKEEEWRTLKGFNGKYQVSTKGNVKSVNSYTRGKWGNTKLSNGRILKSYTSIGNAPGYKRVCLSKNGKAKHFSIHRLVAEAFIDNPRLLPCVNHKDSNRSNNNIDNLEWCTHKGNIHHALINGRMKPTMGDAHPCAKLTSVLACKIRSEYKKNENGYLRISRKYGLNKETIRSLILRETWKHVPSNASR